MPPLGSLLSANGMYPGCVKEETSICARMSKVHHANVRRCPGTTICTHTRRVLRGRNENRLLGRRRQRCCVFTARIDFPCCFCPTFHVVDVPMPVTLRGTRIRIASVTKNELHRLIGFQCFRVAIDREQFAIGADRTTPEDEQCDNEASHVRCFHAKHIPQGRQSTRSRNS